MSAEDGENDLPIDDGDDGEADTDEDGEGGESLADRLGRRFQPDIAHAILDDIAAQLASLHGRGVAHGALEPTRVLIRAEPGRRAPRVEVIEAGAAPMNLMYSAPEVARGAFDARSDVYSLGAIAHHLIVGQPPDRGGAPPSDLWPGIPGRTESLLVRMLSIDPADRPSIVEARQGFAAFDAPPWWKSWKTVTAAAGTVFVVVLGVIILQPAAKTPTPSAPAESPPATPVGAVPPTPAVPVAPPPAPTVPPPTAAVPDARPVVVAVPDARPAVVTIPDARPAVVAIPDARPVVVAPPPPPPPVQEKPRVVEKPVPPPPPPPVKPAPVVEKPAVAKPAVEKLPSKPKPVVAAPPPVAKPKPKPQPQPPAKKPKADDDLMDPFGKK